MEIDKKIADLAKKYFELKDNEATIYINDGRTFLAGKGVKKYDLIMVDAYHDITIPFHMSTKEFFIEVKKHLNAEGVLLININMKSKKHTEIVDYLTQTVKSVMNKVYNYDVSGTTNTLVFASDDKDCKQHLLENINKIDENHPLKAVSNSVYSNLKEITASKLIFTDEVATVEILGQRVLDDIVSEELSYYKKQIEASGKGIWGIFDLLSE